jgi:hypothetical protein
MVCTKPKDPKDVLILSDGITATGSPDEELVCGLIDVAGSESNEGRDRSTVGSPEDQIEEISPTRPSVEFSPAFTRSSHLSTCEAPANPMYYRGSPEDQIEKTLPTSPSVKSSPEFTPSLYPSTSEAPANLMYYRESPENQIEKIPSSNPSVNLSQGFTPTTYTSTSEALANARWHRGSQYQTPYPVAQSINYRAPFTQVCSSHS